MAEKFHIKKQEYSNLTIIRLCNTRQNGELTLSISYPSPYNTPPRPPYSQTLPQWPEQ